MGTNKAPDAGWRGSKELWLGAAYEILVESGIDQVRIQPLSKKLALSRTSFYWFFTDREALLAALLGLWREKNSGNLIHLSSAYAESLTEALFNVFDCWLDAQVFDSAFEFAVRSWALQAPEVGEAIRQADAARIAALVAMFLRFGFDPTAADVRARTIYLTQLGYISMSVREDLAVRMERIPQYVEIFSGVAAKPHEIARFYARHSFVDLRPGTGARAARTTVVRATGSPASPGRVMA